jgi:hypothetical protein
MRPIIEAFKGPLDLIWGDVGTGDKVGGLFPLKAIIWAYVGLPLDKDILIVGGIVYYL